MGNLRKIKKGNFKKFSTEIEEGYADKELYIKNSGIENGKN